jgi:putative ABC transport system ATP-binding protein
MVTHEATALGSVQRSLKLRDGRLVEDLRHG